MVRESEKPKKQEIKAVPLRKLLFQVKSQEELGNITQLLSTFSCEKDKDIENFLRNRAIDFEQINKARTYLVCDAAEGRIVILGYFSISLKVLELSDELSNRKRKILDGLSAKLHGRVIKSVPCYLIGQLAKNSDISGEQAVDGTELINRAISIIRSAEMLVGGRYVLVECRDTPELIKFYEDNNFEQFEKLPFENAPMVQMLRTLCDTAL